MMRNQAGRVQQSVGEFFEHQPLALGVLGAALGAGVAALLPNTDLERQYLGDTSDAVKEEARRLSAEALGEAKDITATAVDDATREAEAQGLTKAGLKKAAASLKRRVVKVADATKSSLKDEAGKAP
jgi:hypothetical protein